MIAAEPKILEELKKGNHFAFQQIFEHYSKQLFLFSLSYLKSREAAEDIIQEVFIKVWNHRSEIKTDTSFRSYLFTITLNSVRKHFEKLSRQNELKHNILVDLTASGPELDDRPDYRFLLDKLEEFINRMPEKRRMVFIKKKIEGKSQKEISEELDITTKTVEYHISEAMKFLKNEFENLQVRGLVFFYLFVN